MKLLEKFYCLPNNFWQSSLVYLLTTVKVTIYGGEYGSTCNLYLLAELECT